MDAPQRKLAQLLWEVGEAAFTDWAGQMARMAQQLGLTISEINTLYGLSVATTLNVSQIAKRTGLSKAAASQLIQRLVEEGLLERRESLHSRREKQISLTQKGQIISRQFDQAILDEITRVFQPVPPKLLTRLNHLLEEVLEHLPAANNAQKQG